MDKPEVQPVMAKRDAVLDRIRKKHADKQYEDDEAYFGQINDDYDEYDKQLGDLTAANEDYKKREAAFSDLFTKDPRSANYLRRWRDGEDPAIALVREYGDDVVAIINDPDRQEEVAAANKEFAARVAKEKELEDQYNNNLKESLAMLDALKSEGMDDDKIDDIMKEYIKLSTDALRGIFTREGVDMIMKAKNYDADVANANEEGIVRGRNEKIEEKLAKSKMGDGHSPLGGEAGRQADKAPRRPLGALDNFGDGNKNIWERGGEKRTKY